MAPIGGAVSVGSCHSTNNGEEDLVKVDDANPQRIAVKANDIADV